MTKARDLANKHIGALIAEAEAERVPTDAVARIMFEKVLEIYRQTRTLEDIASELTSAAEHLDPDEDFEFMRP